MRVSQTSTAPVRASYRRDGPQELGRHVGKVQECVVADDRNARLGDRVNNLPKAHHTAELVRELGGFLRFALATTTTSRRTE